MLEPFGSEIIRLFRLLTPHEIDKYIDEGKEEVQVQKLEGSVVAGGEFNEFAKDDPKQKFETNSKFPQKQAKILPLNKNEEEHSHPKPQSAEAHAFHKNTESGFRVNKAVSQVQSYEPETELESLGILSSSAIRQIESDRHEEENKRKDSATVFLLKQRERMRTSKRRLVEQVAIKTYKSSAAQEYHQSIDEDLMDEDESGDMRGILVNKKQA